MTSVVAAAGNGIEVVRTEGLVPKGGEKDGFRYVTHSQPL